MKKRVFAMVITVMTAFAFAGCGGNEVTEKPQAPDLAGEWKQSNSNSDDAYQIATIQDDTIEVYWYTESDETKALYWAGTYIAPETADEPYTWDSTADHEKTDSALLASMDDTKTFTYESDQISYEVSAMGITQTVRLEKVTE